MPDRDACTVAKAKLQCKDYPYSQVLLGKGLDTCKIYLIHCISSLRLWWTNYVSSKKKKKKKKKNVSIAIEISI